MAKQQETDFVKEALLDIQSIKAALTENAKETLRAIAREEIDSVINESLSEDDDFEEEDVEGEMEGSEEGEADVDTEPYDGETEGDELDVDSLEGDDELEIELDDTEMGGEDEVDMDDMDVVDVDLSDAPDEEEIDLTDASDDMVLSVYKELTDTDEIEVVGDEIHMDIKELESSSLNQNNQP